MGKSAKIRHRRRRRRLPYARSAMLPADRMMLDDFYAHILLGRLPEKWVRKTYG